MSEEIIKEIEAARGISAIQKYAKDRYRFIGSKKFKKSAKKTTAKVKEEEKEKSDFVGEVKRTMMYGDTGHGVLLDRKV